MATTTKQPEGYKSHIERTAAEPRDEGLYDVTIKHIQPCGRDIRVIRLATDPSGPAFKFLPGQWLDVFTPLSPKPGGFTITSPPSTAVASPTRKIDYGYVELAIQSSPTNPPAVYFHQEAKQLIGQKVQVRVGGSFVWPHAGNSIPPKEVKRYAFVAGGVGINPLISIVSHLDSLHDSEYCKNWDVTFLYSTKRPPVNEETESLDPDSVLFLNRLADIFVNGYGSVFGEPGENGGSKRCRLKLFFTGGQEGDGGDGVIDTNEASVPFFGRRMKKEDLLDVLGPVEERAKTVVYVCGVPTMTDEFVEVAKGVEGMNSDNVLSEKWW